MFKALGYKPFDNSSFIEKEYLNRKENTLISFYTDKTFKFSCEDEYNEFISIELYEAITQQMKELEWIK